MKKLLLLPAIIMLFQGCSTLKVTSDMDKSVDFSQYKTFEYFGWAEESDKILNQLDRERIEKAFASEFKKRGLEFVEDNGDLVVTLFIVVEKKTQKTAYTNNYGYYGRFYGYGPGWSWGPGMTTTTITEYDYNVGTLVVDVFDKANEKLIWEGIGTKTLDEDPKTRDKNVPRAVSYIMKRFPVAPVKE